MSLLAGHASDIDLQASRVSLPTWAEFELGRAPVFWKTANGLPPSPVSPVSTPCPWWMAFIFDGIAAAASAEAEH
jgi:hypothetical protein